MLDAVGIQGVWLSFETANEIVRVTQARRRCQSSVLTWSLPEERGFKCLPRIDDKAVIRILPHATGSNAAHTR